MRAGRPRTRRRPGYGRRRRDTDRPRSRSRESRRRSPRRTTGSCQASCRRSLSQLDLDVDAGRQVEPHKRVDRLRGRRVDVDQALVRAHLEVLPRVLVLERRADYAVNVLLGGQGHGPGDGRAGALGGLHDLARRLVELLVVVALESDADLALRHRRSLYLSIAVTTPAPTVRPPSRSAKRSPWSMAIGWINSMSMFVLSPGMTISWPSGSLIAPVTSVVRK